MTLDGTTEIVENTVVAAKGRFLLPDETMPDETVPDETMPPAAAAAAVDGETRLAPLGAIIGARSGDKGGAANVGLFARSAGSILQRLDAYLTEARLRTLLPYETDGLQIERHRFPNLWSLNFVVHGLLGRGVAENSASGRAGEVARRVRPGEARRHPGRPARRPDGSELTAPSRLRESAEVGGEPVEHRLVGLGGGLGVVARAGVVEERVVDAVERAQLVRRARPRRARPAPSSRLAFTRSSSSA